MSKVIKIKQADVEKMVKNILEQQVIDTKEQEQPGVKLTLGQSEDGTFYIMKDGESENPEVVAKTK